MSRPGAWVLPGLLAGVMIGIATADAGWVPAALVVTGAGSAGVAVVAAVGRPSWRGAAWMMAGVLVAGVAVGGVRGSLAAPPLGDETVAALPADEPLRLTGVVIDDPTPRGSSQDVILEDIHLGDRSPAGRLLVRIPRGLAVAARDAVALEVAIRAPDRADPEEAAYRERLKRQGIGAMASAWELRVVGHRSVPILEPLAGLRRWLLDGLVRTVPEPEAALGAGILLGVRAGIDPAIRDAFAVAGLSHVVAISGWNVAIVVALIVAATRRLRERFGPRLPALVAMAAVAGYVILVGASPAVVRAAVMAAALLLARLGGSPAHAASALMGAVLAMLLVAPAALWDVGFQLSALATGGLIMLAAPIEARLGGWPGWIRTPVALTIAAQLATLPVLLATFEQVSLVAPLANVLVVPLIPAVMAGAAVAAVVGALTATFPLPVAGDLGTWLAGGAAWLPLRGLIVTGTAAAEVPLAAVPVTGAPWFTAAWYPALAFVALRLTRPRGHPDPTLEPLDAGEATNRYALPEAAAFGPVLRWIARPRRVALVLVGAVVLATVLTGPDGRLHLTVLDIGQGDAILIETPDGTVALVDGGPDPDLTLRRIGQELPFHRRRIDIVVLSHPHQDHLGGLFEVIRRYQVGALLVGGRPPETDPDRALRTAAAAEPGGRVVAARSGQSIPLGGAVLEVLFPTAADVAAPLLEDDVNNSSIVIRLRYGRFEALLTGDAEAPVETLLVERGRLDQVDVLKVGHHGSDSSTTAPFLAAVSPAVAVISAGVGNSYGHPHRSTLDHLAALPGMRVFRTDRDGSVEIATDGVRYWIRAGGRQVGPFPAGGTAPASGAAGTIGR
jgi:competence protein ComEC